MSEEQDIFDEALQDVDPKAPAAEAPVVAEDETPPAPPAATEPPEGQDEPPGAAPSAAQEQPKPALPREALGLLKELQEERFARQEAQRKAEEYQRAVENFQRQQQAAQRAEQQKPAEPPDQFADPAGYNNYWLQREQQLVQTLQERARMEKLEESLDDAAEQHGKAFEEAYQAVLSARDPALVAKLTASPRRAGKAIMEWHRQQEVLRTVGNDPAAYRAKLQDELLNDQAFVAKVIERVRAQPGQPAPQSRPQNVTRLPPSMNRVAAAAPAAEGDEDGSEEAIFAEAERPRRRR